MFIKLRALDIYPPRGNQTFSHYLPTAEWADTFRSHKMELETIKSTFLYRAVTLKSDIPPTVHITNEIVTIGFVKYCVLLHWKRVYF